MKIYCLGRIIMKIKRFMTVAIIPLFLFSSCNKGNKNIDYKVEYYFESLAGEYVINDSYTITASAQDGTTFNADVKDVEGFTFEQNNAKNKISGTLSSTNNEFAVYYSRNQYNVTVYGGTADKNQAKFEDTVTITPNIDGSEITLEGKSKASLNGNVVTMGAEDVVVRCSFNSKIALDSTLFTGPTNFSCRANIKVDDQSTLSGLVFLYNSQNMSADGNVKFYLLGAFNGILGFYLFSKGFSNTIKVFNGTVSTSGYHSYGASVDDSGNVRCFFDDVNLFDVSTEEIVAKGFAPISEGGRVGIYSNNYAFDYKDLSVPAGAMSLLEVKNYYLTQFSSFSFSKHQFVYNSDAFHMDGGVVDIYLDTIPQSKKGYQNYAKSINSATNIAELDKALAGAFAFKLEAQKAYTKQHLLDLIHDVHYSTFMFFVESVSAKYEGSTITLYRDYLERDLRPYVPDAYKLYGEEGKVCLLDQLDIDLAEASNESEVFAISDLYYLDLVRAICFKDCEYFYWEQDSKYPGSTFQIWWFLYTYNSADDGEFVYVGNVFQNYHWTKDYRLNKAIYGPGGSNYSLNIIQDASWIMQHQTINSRSYKVTLNSDGGELSSYELNGTSDQELALPTPTKEGYVFDGWYPSRLLKGDKVTSIAVDNLHDITLYAAYKKDGARVSSDLLIAPYITENMVIQQNKPIVISGTGKDGLSVEATFDGVTKSTTIADGKWQLVFDAQAASFVSKTLIVSSGDIVYTFNNILIGEVWLAAGQSNMEMLMTWLNGRGFKYLGQYGDFTNLSKIRLFRQYVDNLPEDYKENYLQDRWVAPESVRDIFDKSILSIAFACYLQEKIGVPVGVLTSCRGGTYIEEWLSSESLAIAGSTLSVGEKSLESQFYNTMTVDLKGMQINGVIWYQGENNWANPDVYKGQFAQLVKQYREIFNDDELVVITQQLVQYGEMDFRGMRLAQWDLMGEVENTYCCCAIDEGEEHDIHPANKLTLGSRMSDIACEYVYHIGSDSLSYSPVSARIAGDKIVISFADGKEIHSDGELKYFKIMKTDNSFVDAKAEIVNNTIVIDYVDDAKAVYYAYESWLGEITLYGGNNKPVAPFVLNIGD